MKPRTLLPLIAAGMCSASAHAEVTLTFDTDLEGFTMQGDATALTWSDVNGGSMAINAKGGWAGNCASLEMPTNTAFFDEMKLAELNGGTLSFDVIVRDDDVIIPADPPGWFEVVVICNSAAGWDQSVKGFGLGGGQWPLDPAEQVFNVSVPVYHGAEAADDGNFTIDTSGGWGNVHLGTNNEGNDGTGTNGVSTEPGSVTIYIDNLTITANEVATPPPSLAIKPATSGLNLISANTQPYTRRMLRTTATANSWVGVATPANPVTYSFTVKDSPEVANYTSFIYLVPSVDGAEIPDYSDPDWQADHCARLTFQRSAAGQPGATAEFAYKVNGPGSNGPDGNNYFTDDSVPSSGLGGILAHVSGADILGTWSLTFTSDTEFTIHAPDGTSTPGAMLPETAALFDAEMQVYFGNVPGDHPENFGLTTVYSNISISGIDAFVDENFTALIEDGLIMPDAFLQVAPANRTGVIVATAETNYWHQWSFPAVGYVLEQSLDLGAVDPWEPMVMDSVLTVEDAEKTSVWRLLDSLETLDPAKNFFRMAKPEPIATP